MPRAIASLLAPCGRACLRWNQLRERRTRRCSKIDPGDTHQASGSTTSWSQLCGIFTSKSQYISFIALLFSCSVMSTLYDPTDCSTLGFPVLHHLLELAQLTSIESMMPSNHLVLCRPFSSCLQSFPGSGSFPVSQVFASGGQIIGASASASVLPMNTQGWFPFGLTGLIFLQSKGLSRVFSSTTVQKHQFFIAYISLIGFLPLLKQRVLT